MSDLVNLCEEAGFTDVRTYIASGNIVLRTDRDAADVKADLEARLRRFTGAEVRVMLRTADEMAAALRACPFPDEPGNRVAIVFLDQAPKSDTLAEVSGQADEVMALGDREIYVHYPRGMGGSKLSIKGATAGTARNMNTVRRLVEMAGT